jgi:hypothetical protein
MDWEYIIEEHGSMVWRTVNRVIPDTSAAADCFQRTFISAWEKEGIFVDSQNKTAGRFRLPEQLANEFATDPITQLQQVRSDNAERLTTEVVDGKDAEVFRVRGIKLFGAETAPSGVWLAA